MYNYTRTDIQWHRHRYAYSQADCLQGEIKLHGLMIWSLGKAFFLCAGFQAYEFKIATGTIERQTGGAKWQYTSDTIIVAICCYAKPQLNRFPRAQRKDVHAWLSFKSVHISGESFSPFFYFFPSSSQIIYPYANFVRHRSGRYDSLDIWTVRYYSGTRSPWRLLTSNCYQGAWPSCWRGKKLFCQGQTLAGIFQAPFARHTKTVNQCN